MSQSTKMTGRHAPLALEQLLAIIRQLDEPALRQVAEVVEETYSQRALAYGVDQALIPGLPSEDRVRDIKIEAKISTALQLSG